VRQLSAVGCRTLWLDHGPHPDHQHQHQHLPALEVQASGGPGGRPEIASVDLSEEHSSEIPLPGGGGGSGGGGGGGGGGGDGGGDGDYKTRAEAGGDVEGVDSLNGRRSLMFLDVEEEIGAAGMVGSSEWLLR